MRHTSFRCTVNVNSKIYQEVQPCWENMIAFSFFNWCYCSASKLSMDIFQSYCVQNRGECLQTGALQQTSEQKDKYERIYLNRIVQSWRMITVLYTRKIVLPAFSMTSDKTKLFFNPLILKLPTSALNQLKIFVIQRLQYRQRRQ